MLLNTGVAKTIVAMSNNPLLLDKEEAGGTEDGVDMGAGRVPLLLFVLRSFFSSFLCCFFFFSSPYSMLHFLCTFLISLHYQNLFFAQTQHLPSRSTDVRRKQGC